MNMGHIVKILKMGITASTTPFKRQLLETDISWQNKMLVSVCVKNFDIIIH